MVVLGGAVLSAESLNEGQYWSFWQIFSESEVLWQDQDQGKVTVVAKKSCVSSAELEYWNRCSYAYG